MLIGIFIGLGILPVLYFLLLVLGIFYRSTRDTVKHFKVPLKDGYSKWNWIWSAPLTWWDMFKVQIEAWWNGYSTTVDVETYDD